ncbi:glycerate kinase [Belliella sp. R4-6]|uniref:Glycerate kinase n=1 Tax=Belliella alkalica TaxID=1730871 RepID=A0ABS9VHR4_9BACT|nr:glycerate kinase [Belliella alkalica]MCH7415525.1 glycerate kinase [Belliella alkalica]
MKILISPNAFKGTMEADIAAAIIGETLQDCDKDFDIELCPIADGGDGTCFLLGNALKLEQKELFALDAIGRPRLGYYFLDTVHAKAYLDISTVSGIKFLNSEEINPWIANSYGTGELIQDAVSNGARHIILGLGGSASIDLGVGILRALGFLFLDEKGRELSMFSDNLLSKIKYIQAPIIKRDLKFTILCDVDNKFFGESGAVPVFGLQKGLESDQHAAYLTYCENLIRIFREKSSKEINDLPGFGAAGGVAFGLAHFFDLTIEMGSKWFFEKVEIEKKIATAELVITGEGRYDSQSAGGKGSYELLQISKKHQKKTILITSGDEGGKDGFYLVMSLPDLDFSKPDFRNTAELNLKQITIDLYKSIKAS